MVLIVKGLDLCGLPFQEFIKTEAFWSPFRSHSPTSTRRHEVRPSPLPPPPPEVAAMSSSDNNPEQGVIGRKLVLCKRLLGYPTADLIKLCPGCERFVLYCCHCSLDYYDERTGRFNYPAEPCHHFRLIFTAGACHSNGQGIATAGIGVANGKKMASKLSIPIMESDDPNRRRSGHRAELLAALCAVTGVIAADGRSLMSERKRAIAAAAELGEDLEEDEVSWIIATDSEYVVKGMTEWLPACRVNEFGSNIRSRIANHSLCRRIICALAATSNRQISTSLPSSRMRYDVRKLSRVSRSGSGISHKDTTRLRLDLRIELPCMEIQHKSRVVEAYLLTTTTRWSLSI